MSITNLIAKIAYSVRQNTELNKCAADKKDIILQLLKEPNTPAATLLVACSKLYSYDVFYWEPETLWLSFERDHKLDLDVIVRDKIQAAISLIRNPVFFSDNLVFQRTTKSFNGEIYDPEVLQECTPASMCWSVYEACVIRGVDPETHVIPDLDEDVQQYIAVNLKRAGFVCAPKPLREINNNLLKMLPAETKKLSDYVWKTWETSDKTSWVNYPFTESPADVQLAQLAATYYYVRDKAILLSRTISQVK
jgi:hypothetical protein